MQSSRRNLVSESFTIVIAKVTTLPFTKEQVKLSLQTQQIETSQVKNMQFQGKNYDNASRYVTCKKLVRKPRTEKKKSKSLSSNAAQLRLSHQNVQLANNSIISLPANRINTNQLKRRKNRKKNRVMASKIAEPIKHKIVNSIKQSIQNNTKSSNTKKSNANFPHKGKEQK